MKFANRIKCLEDRSLLDAFEIKDKEGLISFAAGFPSMETYPLRDIEESLDRVMKNHGKEALSYCATSGYLPLREIMKERMRNKFSVDYLLDEIIITSGSQQGVDMSGLLFVNPGDVVIFEEPSYLGAVNALRAHEAKLLGIETDDEGIVLHKVKEALDNNQVKLVYVNPDFQNPTGKSWSKKRREDFIELMSNYDVPILEDGAYGELSFEGELEKPLAYYDKKGQVIYVGTFSKIFCPGLRVAWLCARKSLMDKFLLLKNAADLSSSTLTQMQMEDYLVNKDIDKHIKKICNLYKHRRDIMCEAINKYFPQEVKYTLPRGGLFLWVKLPNELNAMEVLKRALEKKVAFIPGNSFYPEDKKYDEIRLNFSNMEDEKTIEGIKILGEVIKSMK